MSPDILGVSAGAAFGAVLGIFLSLDVWAIQGLAFVFGLGGGAAYAIAASLRGHDPILVLVLAGVVLGALLGAASRREVPRRSVQPAAGDHLLAARQPRGDESG